MRISICIPQYNRIEYLLKSLQIIEGQTYNDIEIVISDDCSKDDTEEKVKALIPHYRYPIIFHRNEKNEGYDRNFRQCIELSTGDYAFVIGNDDTLNGKDAIQFLVDFLEQENLPDFGFCNMQEERTGNKIIKRAFTTADLGYGVDVAMKFYTCFTFVGGLIYKKNTFSKFNTAKFDGSIFSQIYLGVLMVASGCRLFSISEPLVIKDILLDGKFRNSYRDRIAKKWKDFKIVDTGLPSVMNVVINALIDSNAVSQGRIKKIFSRVYAFTYPHWILDYKENKAVPEAFGLLVGMYPGRNANFRRLNFVNRIYIYALYGCATFAAFLTPVFFFKKVKDPVYNFLKR